MKMLGLALLLSMPLLPGAANAVVYCKTVGVPKGCVVRPVPVAPVARAVTPGVGAPGVGVTRAPGVGGVGAAGSPNLGGPVNRVGVR